ncbi:MAG: endonuclease MutS2 [Bacilli bacterium]|nr:endonuclease MutS2 [Bacilli bacterium]
MRSINEILEFNTVLEKLANFAVTLSAKTKIINLEVSTDYYYIEEELKKTEEILNITYKYGKCPIDFIHEILPSLDRAYKGGNLSIEELYHISIQAEGISRIKSFAKSIEMTNIDNFNYICNSLNPIMELKKEVERCISPTLTIYDNASSVLSNIRKEIKNKENEIRKTLNKYLKNNEDYLSDLLITIRNDRLVIPVKSAHKYAFGGIIHDQSDSGQTFFVEPEEVVSINSKLQVLKHKESEEIEKIIQGLTDIVRKNYEDFKRNFELIVELDFLFAKGAYGKQINAKIAELSNNKEIFLIKARHPLLDFKKVIANDFKIGNNFKNILLVTGPNTGGKTVSLKTVGLLVMMNQAGLAIPVDFEAKLSVFSNIFVDIGDEQSIEQSLSTFSSHLRKIINIVDAVDENSLIIVDELGGGTDPRQGEALAMSILDYFHGKNALVLATTHYSNLKKFAIDEGYIANASLMFDSDKIEPKYKLIYDVSGKSYAFEISQRLGLRKSIIEEALKYYKKYSSQSDIMIEKLEEAVSEVDSQKRNIEIEKSELNDKIIEYNLKLQELSKEKEKIKEESNEEIKKIVSNAEEEINKIINELKSIPNDEIKMHQWIQTKHRIKNMIDTNESDIPKSNEDFSINEIVFLPMLNKTARVVRINKDDYGVEVGNVMLNINKNQLQKYNKKLEKPKITIVSKAKKEKTLSECNLIGMHIDEALVVLDKYLDDALLMHYKFVRIIHGSGTGVLRKAVHKFLDNKNFIESYRLGGAGEGGVGATVVTFKQ